jgi:hypothetical protein
MARQTKSTNESTKSPHRRLEDTDAIGPSEDQHGANGGGQLDQSTEVDGDEEERAHQSKG